MSKQARYSITTLQDSRIDAEAGVIKDVAVMSIGPALGHGMRVDLSTLQALMSLSANGGVKAFLNHENMPSPTQAIGIFSGFYIDPEKDGSPAKLRATFKAFNAFRQHSPKEYATLFELAKEAPGSFGVSVSIFQDWEDADDGGDPYIRPISFDSADFVSSPAANKSLFSAEKRIDETPTENKEVIIKVLQPKISRPAMIKIYSKFSANQVALARAVKFMAENPEATEETAIDSVEKELSAEEVASMKEENARLKAENAALVSKISALEGEKEELAGPAGEAPALKEKVAELSSQLSEASGKISSYVAKLSRFGVSALKLEVLSKDAPKVELKKITGEQFTSMSPAERNDFRAKGGQIE